MSFTDIDRSYVRIWNEGQTLESFQSALISHETKLCPAFSLILMLYKVSFDVYDQISHFLPSRYRHRLDNYVMAGFITLF